MERPEQLRGADKSNELSSRDVDEFQQAILEGGEVDPGDG